MKKTHISNFGMMKGMKEGTFTEVGRKHELHKIGSWRQKVAFVRIQSLN